MTASAERAFEAVIEPSADHALLGIGVGGWTGAATLYALGAAAAVLVSWTTLRPQPWPDGGPVFRVVFETPVEPSAPDITPPATEMPPVAPAVPPPVEAAAPVEAAPPVDAAPAPSLLAEAAPPPPRKPYPRPRHAPASAAPATVVPGETRIAAATTIMPAPPLAPPGDSAYVPPRPISAGNPAYPAEARQHGWQGRVLLHLEISADGTVSASVKSSSGHAALDGAALAEARSWRFAPATRGGVTVIGSVERAVEFRLED